MPSASAILDAGVLVVPAPEAGADDAHRYVERLLEWARLLDEPWIAVCLSEGACQALSDDGLFPLREQLQKLFSRNGIVEYDVNTVAAVIDRLLSHTPSFETYFRVRDVLADSVSSTPDVLQLSGGTGLQSELARCLVLIAILRKHCGTDILQNALIVQRAPGRIIVVRALVHDFEHLLDGLENALPTPPDYFEGEVLACDSFRSLLECIEESEVLRNATDDLGVEIAIRIGLYKNRLARNIDPNWDDVGRIRMGRKFGETVRRCCGNTALSVSRSVIRSACETIDEQNMTATHWLRVGNDQRIRKRDDAGAWRRDIDYEYHLHYWENEDGTVELASMVVHNDFTIPE